MIVLSCSVPVEINTQWQLQQPPESTPYSPSSELDSSSARQESPVSSHSWVKQEPEPEAIQGGNMNSEAATDAEKDKNLNSAVTSTVLFHFLRISELIGISIFHWWDITLFFLASGTFNGGFTQQCYADHHQTSVPTGEQTGEDWSSGETGAGPTGGSQVPPLTDREPHWHSLGFIVWRCGGKTSEHLCCWMRSVL